MVINKQNKLAVYALSALALCILPLLLQGMGNFWVRIADMALLYVLLALGLNIVVGYAGLLDLGYVAFFAVGAYLMAILTSPDGPLNAPLVQLAGESGAFWLALPFVMMGAAFTGLLIGAPVLRLRGDYLAIVTLGFGEIIRVFLNNLDHPVNLTNGPKGLSQIDGIRLFKFEWLGIPGLNLARPLEITEDY